MKSFVSLFALSAVAAEADPQLFINSPLAYHTPVVAQTPFVHTSPLLSSIVQTPYVSKVVSADQKKVVEVEYPTAAVPSVVSTYNTVQTPYVQAVQTPFVQTPYVQNVQTPYVHGVQTPFVQTPYTYGVQQPMVYAQQPAQVQVTNYEAIPKYYAKNGEVEHKVYRRDAEADAEADPALFYSNYYNSAYNTPYAGAYATQYAAATPYAGAYATQYAGAFNSPAVAAFSPYTAAYASPYAGAFASPYYHGATVVPTGVKTYANNAVSPQQYASKGQYVAVNEGAIHIAKRSADAESSADPGLLYPNYYNTPYSTYNTAGVYAAPRYAAATYAAPRYTAAPAVAYAGAYNTPYSYSPYTAGVYNRYNSFGQYYL